MALDYQSYLEIEKLLALQKPQSKPEEHDEMLFIVIHQAYELWFKQILHEFGKVQKDFTENNLYGAIHTFKRVRTILKTLVQQVDILETMTPMSFTSFRDFLESSSGFQSVQFRVFEFAIGFRRAEMIEYHAERPWAQKLLRECLEQPSVVDYFYKFLAHQGVEIPQELLERDLSQTTVANQQVQDGIYKLYQESPDVSILLELMTDLDEGLQEWRYRHTKLVERTIGSKQGTGGSLGVNFLKQSLFKPVFPDLWDVRHRL